MTTFDEWNVYRCGLRITQEKILSRYLNDSNQDALPMVQSAHLQLHTSFESIMSLITSDMLTANCRTILNSIFQQLPSLASHDSDWPPPNPTVSTQLDCLATNIHHALKSMSTNKSTLDLYFQLGLSLPNTYYEAYFFHKTRKFEWSLETLEIIAQLAIDVNHLIDIDLVGKVNTETKKDLDLIPFEYQALWSSLEFGLVHLCSRFENNRPVKRRHYDRDQSLLQMYENPESDMHKSYNNVLNQWNRMNPGKKMKSADAVRKAIQKAKQDKGTA